MASSVSSVTSAQTQQIDSKSDARYEGCCSKVKRVSIIVAKIAFQIFFVSASIIATAALFPASAYSFALPIIGLGAAVLSACILAIFSPSNQLRSSTAPLGLPNYGNDCWANSNVHFLESDPFIRKFLRDLSLKKLNREQFLNLLNDYQASQDLIENFKKYAQGKDPLVNHCTHELFQEYVKEQLPLSMDEEKAILLQLKETFDKREKISDSFKVFYQGYDAALLNNMRVGTDLISRNLRLALNQINNLILTDNSQLDAAEPLTAILDLIPPSQKVKIEQTFQLDTSGIQGAFDPSIATSQKVQYHPMLSLSFNPQKGGNASLEDLLEYYLHRNGGESDPVRRTVNGINYDCLIQTETNRFLEVPSALRFQIKRFSYKKVDGESGYISVKNSTPVSIPNELEIDLPNNQKQKYTLASFVVHLGNSVNNGHYIACRNVEGKKYYMSDQDVTEIDEKKWKEYSSRAYLVLYIAGN